MLKQPFKGDRMCLLSCRQARSYHPSREATAMILGDVFERFAQDSPLSVMARGVLENALNPQVVDQLFEDVADKQYTKQLLFSSIVDLMIRFPGISYALARSVIAHLASCIQPASAQNSWKAYEPGRLPHPARHSRRLSG